MLQFTATRKSWPNCLRLCPIPSGSAFEQASTSALLWRFGERVGFGADTVSHHLRTRDAGLIDVEEQGTDVLFINRERIQMICDRILSMKTW